MELYIPTHFAKTFLIFQENPLANIKKIDCALLPPSRRTLRKKILRAQYVTALWSKANTANPNEHMSPDDYGWSRKEDLLQPLWYDGPSIPESLFTTNTDTRSEDHDNANADTEATFVYSQEEDETSDDSDNMRESDDEPWSEDSESEEAD